MDIQPYAISKSVKTPNKSNSLERTNLNGKLRVLVVENHQILALDLKKMIEKEHVVKSVVLKGEDVVEVVREFQPDLLLINPALRGNCNGVQAAEMVTRSMLIPVVFLVTSITASDFSEMQIVNPVAIIKRPYYNDQLMSQINLCEPWIGKIRKEEFHNAKIKRLEEKLIRLNRESKMNKINRKLHYRINDSFIT